MMIKKFTLFVALGLLVSTVNAQDKKEKGGTQGTNISIGAEAGLPMGDFADGWKAGFGGSAKAAFNVVNNGYITLSAGYISFAGKGTGLGSIPSMNLLPIKAGFRYQLGSGGFYIEPQIGWTIAKLKGSDNSESSFTWAPNVGIMINNMIDLSARYESFSNDGTTISHAGLRLAYNFNLGGRK